MQDSLHIPHFTLHIPHFTLHTPHSTFHTPHSTFHIPHSTLHTPHLPHIEVTGDVKEVMLRSSWTGVLAALTLLLDAWWVLAN